MDFDWKPLAGTLIKAGAPLIGGMLLGPLGSTAGNVLGSIVASALGVEPTPEAVGAAVQNGDPAAVSAALAAADNEAAAKWEAIARIAEAQANVDKTNIEQVNATIQAENANGVSWWHWRHLIGYATLLWSVAVLPPFVLAMWRGDATALTAITAALTSAIPFFAILAGLNGYVAQDTTKLKTVAMVGEHPQGAVATVVKAVTGKQAKR